MSKQFFITAAALASPVIWFASHTIQFALAPLTCSWHSNAILWIVSACALLLDAGSGFVAWSGWRQERKALAIGGITLSSAFFVVIVAQAIPTLILMGCD